MTHLTRRRKAAGFTLVEVLVAMMIMAILAVVKAGGVYVPVDPSLPAVRVAALVAEVDPVVVAAHIVTALPAMLEGMLVHPYTKETVQMFLADGEKALRELP